MKSRTLVSVLLCLHACLITLDFSTGADEPEKIVTVSTNTEEPSKLLLECQHSDYRTYIKCLKRHKRHHWHNEHDSEGGEMKNKCFEECGIDHCESTKCVHDCHKRCMKKTKETRQIITQYETTCESGDCKEESGKSDDLPATNITTNIDINNVINNHIPKTEGPEGEPKTCIGHVPYCCGGILCPGGGWYGANTGLSLVPQIQFVPQLTFALGASTFGGFGGGYLPGGQTGGVDCSPCGNPLLRYRCDVSCYSMQGTGQMNLNTGPKPTNTPCQSPHCVGGG